MKTNPNIPDRSKLPQQFKTVQKGLINEGDLLWTPETEAWEPACPGEIGFSVSEFKQVARDPKYHAHEKAEAEVEAEAKSGQAPSDFSNQGPDEYANTRP